MASQPNKGKVRKPTRSRIVGTPRVSVDAPSEWKIDKGLGRQSGIRVVLRREPGMTPDGMLVSPYRFQCPPIGRFGRPRSADWQTYEALDGQERTRPGVVRLGKWPIDTLLVDHDQPFVAWRDFDVERLLREMRQLHDRHVPFRLVCTHPTWRRPLVNTIAALTVFEPEQRVDVGTEYLHVEFMEVDRLKAGRRRTKASSGPKKVDLAEDDTLHGLARKHLGKASRWREIAKRNKIPAKIAPDKAAPLWRWAQRHKRKTLTIPQR